MAVFVDTGAWFAYFVRRDPNHFFHDVMQEAIFATERCAREVMPAFAGT
jgi:predicted nucleic acid-binding protein